MKRESIVLSTTVPPGDLKFYGFKPFILNIDERQRHLSLSGDYKDGQKKYLLNIIKQDIGHVKYTERYGQLVPRHEHPLLINGVTIISSGRSNIHEMILAACTKYEGGKSRFFDENPVSLSENDIWQHLNDGGVLSVEYNKNKPQESMTGILHLLLKLSSQLASRPSRFIHSIIIEDVDLFINQSVEFASCFKILINDKRKNRCAMSVNFEKQLSEEYFKGIKNHLRINMNNTAYANLSKCGKSETFSFMPFAPIDSF